MESVIDIEWVYYQDGEEEFEWIYSIRSNEYEYLKIMENDFQHLHNQGIENQFEIYGEGEGYFLIFVIPDEDEEEINRFNEYVDNFEEMLRYRKLEKLTKKL